ncbi:hypothetical protein D3C80_982630 [compost metagenome]
MRRNRQEDIEIARRAATGTGFALALKADTGTVLDAGRDVDRERTLFGHTALAVALCAGIGDRLAAAMTGRAGALNREEALGSANATRTLTGAAGLGLRAGLGARTGADVAGDRGRNPDLRCLPGKRFFQRNFHVVAKIGAAFAATGRTARTTAAHHLAKDVFENVGEATGTTAETAATAHAALFEGCMTVTIIGCALLRIL